MNSKALDTKNDKPILLIAEDDPDQSDMLKETLEDEGYAVDTAFSGETAFHKLLHHQYDLAILDIRMPGMYGSDVLKQYRKREKDKHLPVVVVSAFATAQEMEGYRAAGADACFAKPYILDELIKKISEYVQGNGRRSAE